MKNLGRAAARAAVSRDVVRSAFQRAAAAPLLPRAVWQRLPVTAEVIPLVFPDGGRFSYRTGAGSAFDRELFWRRLQSPEGWSVLAFYCLASRARFTVDVGAHAGLYTLTALAANLDGHVLAFEPVPSNTTCWCRTFITTGGCHDARSPWRRLPTCPGTAVQHTGRVAAHLGVVEPSRVSQHPRVGCLPERSRRSTTPSTPTSRWIS